MSDKEKFLELYENWPDEQLLKEFAKRSEYNQAAQEAMSELITSRGLQSTLDQQRRLEVEKIAKKKKRQSEGVSVVDRLYSMDVETITDKEKMDFLEEAFTAEGAFGEFQILNYEKRGWVMFTGVVGLTGLILTLTGANTGINFFEKWLIPLVLICAILLVVATYLTIKQYGKLNVEKIRDGKISFKINCNQKKYDFETPVRCEYYATKTVHKVNGIKVYDYFTLIMLFNLSDGTSLSLVEQQAALVDCPEGWTHIDYYDSSQSADVAFDFFGRRHKKGLIKLRLMLEQEGALL